MDAVLRGAFPKLLHDALPVPILSHGHHCSNGFCSPSPRRRGGWGVRSSRGRESGHLRPRAWR
jgi:hypothetical protein